MISEEREGKSTMKTSECYDRLGGDYEEILQRFKTEARIQKFLGMLLRDTSYSNLCTALGEKDYDAAFRAAHTLKGVALNLGLGRLAKSSSVLTEALRARQENDAVRPLFLLLEQDYTETCALVKQLLENGDKAGDR